MANKEIVANLKRVELFLDLTPEQLSEIADRVERMKFREGGKIAEDGAACDAALLVVEGTAELRFGADAVDSDDVIKVGSVIAEMAMFIDYVSGATIVAKSAVKCLRISRDAMHEIMLADPGLAEKLTHRIAQRLVELADDLRSIDASIDFDFDALQVPISTASSSEMAATAL